MRHFLTLKDLEREELLAILDRADALKKDLAEGKRPPLLAGHTLGMIFEKASTRTRVSFEAGMNQLGGHAIMLAPRDTQMGRGEPLEDTARVLSGYLDVIMIRTFSQEMVETFASYSRVPVINGLTDLVHPCQLLADLMTIRERRGSLEDQVVAWVGDGNNMAHSWINAAWQLGFELRLACPAGYQPAPQFLEGNDHVRVTESPADAVAGATVVTTDVWASMGQEDEAEARARAFEGFLVDEALMAGAADDAMVLHCLPAHRDEEISDAVLEGPQSAVWDEAENRLHAQKALVLWLLDR